MTTLARSSEPPSPIRICARCGSAFDWRRSTSGSLKMTYCNSLCERAALGFTLEGLMQVQSAGSHGQPPPADV